MPPIASEYDAITQVAVAGVAAVLLIVSIAAYRRRPEGRYFLLMLAFGLFCVVSVSTTFLEFFTASGPEIAQTLETYLNPSLELLMGVSFLVAVLWTSKSKRRLGLAFLATVVIVGAIASTIYVASSANTNNAGAPFPLPQGCSRPPGGFLIIASSTGYNDSIAHGAPFKSWPVLNVSKDTEVSIIVCNAYSQAVGFQVTHYLEDQLEAIPSGKVLNVAFLANQTGTFAIYCAVFNPIHIYLQGGQLNVS